MARKIEISDGEEDRFNDLIDTVGWEMNVDERINYMMGLGKLRLNRESYQPIDRHEDCVTALEFALRARDIDHDQYHRYDLLYACAAVALSSPDDVEDELRNVIHR